MTLDQFRAWKSLPRRRKRDYRQHSEFRRRCAEAGIPPDTVRYRMQTKGMTLAEALVWRRPRKPGVLLRWQQEIAHDRVYHRLPYCASRAEINRLMEVWR